MMKYRTIVLFFLLIFLSGCSAWPFGAPDDFTGDWKEDVLWAQECGEDGLPCCADKEPACLYGLLCCEDPRGGPATMCRESCGCGGAGSFCCAGEPACAGGLACAERICASCGGGGEPCCPAGTSCADGLVCHRGRCVTCGLPGNPCCADGPACAAAAERTDARTECREGICVFCGGEAKVACAGEPACNTGHLLNNGFCYRCGGYNQPCCDEAVGLGFACDPAQGLTCILGFCSRR